MSHLTKLIVFAPLVAALALVGCNGDGQVEGSGKDALYAADPSGDFVCEDDPSATLTKLKGRKVSDITTAFAGTNGSSDCTNLDRVVSETEEVVNAAQMVSNDDDECTTGNYGSLGGGEVVMTSTMTNFTIETGSFIDIFGVTEVFCAEAGPNTEQTFEVSVSESQTGPWTVVGECTAQIPCQIPCSLQVPDGV